MATAPAASVLRRLTGLLLDAVLLVYLCAQWVSFAANIVLITARWAGAGEIPAVRRVGNYSAIVFGVSFLMYLPLPALLALKGRLENSEEPDQDQKLYRRDSPFALLVMAVTVAFVWVLFIDLKFLASTYARALSRTEVDLTASCEVVMYSMRRFETHVKSSASSDNRALLTWFGTLDA